MTHHRISVHEVSFPSAMTLPEIVGWSKRHDIPSIGLFSLRRNSDWNDAVACVAASDIKVPYLSHASMFKLDDEASWHTSTQALFQTIDAAAQMGTPLVYATTGPAGRLDFDEAVNALKRAVAPVLEYAASSNVELLTETANPIFGFTHFLHTFEDTVYACAETGLGICLDVHPVWHERAIRQKIIAAIGQVRLVQVSDHIPRNMTVSRDVVSSGVVPIESLLTLMLERGYTGVIDLELFGRPPNTALNDILISASRLTEMLIRIDA